MSGELSGVDETGAEWYDPELAFLRVLERDIGRHARRVAAARARERAHAARAHTAALHANEHRSRGRGRRRGAHGRRPDGTRVARRSLTLLALLFLIAASAFGAGRIFSAGPPNPGAVSQSALVSVAGGVAGGDRWTLRVYARGAELCRVLLIEGQAESSRCSTPPGARGVGVTSVLSATRRYVFGVSGEAVAGVSLKPTAGPSGSLSAPTHALEGASPAKPLGGERWFVAIVRRPVGEPDPPLRVEGLDRDYRRVGAAVVDCAEGSTTRACPG